MSKKITKEEFIEKANSIHNNKYDYSKTEYIRRDKKVIIICPVHGEFEQFPFNHIKGNGCYLCSKNKKLTQEDFINNSNIIHNNFYDYSKVEYINSNTKVIIICPVHGEFKQLPNNHMSGHGCYECSLEKLSKSKFLTTEEFIKKSKDVHNNKYDYSKVNYINSYVKVCIICPEHGEFLQTPNNHMNNSRGCPICKSSKGELKIKSWLDSHNIDYFQEYKFGDCKNEKQLRFDFFLPSYNLCIEYDGEQHHMVRSVFGEKEFLKTQERDQIKNQYCLDNNIELLRIPYWNFKKIKVILEDIVCQKMKQKNSV